jgi:PhnB protein
MFIQSYLNFDGRCDEALDFYRNAVDAKVEMLMRFGEAPPSPMMPPNSKDKVMHVAFRIGDTILLATDSECKGKPTFQGISLTLTAANELEAEKVFAGLSKGGTVRMPLSKTFFAKSFGQLTDKFGVAWMVIVPA